MGLSCGRSFFFFNEALVEVEVKTLGVSEGREFSVQRFGRAGDLAIWQVDLLVFPQFGTFAEQNQMPTVKPKKSCHDY